MEFPENKRQKTLVNPVTLVAKNNSLQKEPYYLIKSQLIVSIWRHKKMAVFNTFDSNINQIKQTETHTVPKNLHQPIRLQEYGVGIFNAIPTKSALKKALKKELITVNGMIASTATMITGGEVIELTIPEIASPNKRLVFKLKVLFEDDHLAIIHKPAGILVSGNSFKTIANALVQNLQQSTHSDATRPQPIHRLDYETTGILMVGKTNSSIRALTKMFENKEVEKIYYAIAIGDMDSKGEIVSEIENKESRSIYQVIETVPSERFDKLNLVKLSPLTGRRHQLRIHLSSIGNPILGDKKYGTDNLILKGKGLYLHAYSLEFTHPFTNERIFLKDELVERFEKIFGDIKA